MVVLTSFPLTRGSVDYDDIIGQEIGRQGTGDVHDHNTRPVSTHRLHRSISVISRASRVSP
eukprot:scaffold24277_cov158-Skeletonema_marinoi.AAC.1